MPRIPAGALLSVNAYKIMFISCRGDQASAQGYFQGCGKLCARDANRGKQALKSLVCSNGQTTDTSEVWLWKAFALRKTTARQCPGAAPGQAWGCSSCLAAAGDTWPGGTVPAVTQGDSWALPGLVVQGAAVPETQPKILRGRDFTRQPALRSGVSELMHFWVCPTAPSLLWGE